MEASDNLREVTGQQGGRGVKQREFTDAGKGPNNTPTHTHMMVKCNINAHKPSMQQQI